MMVFVRCLPLFVVLCVGCSMLCVVLLLFGLLHLERCMCCLLVVMCCLLCVVCWLVFVVCCSGAFCFLFFFLFDLLFFSRFIVLLFVVRYSMCVLVVIVIGC